MRELIELHEEEIENRGGQTFEDISFAQEHSDLAWVDPQDTIDDYLSNEKNRDVILKLKTGSRNWSKDDIDITETALEQTGEVWFEEGDLRYGRALRQARNLGLVAQDWNPYFLEGGHNLYKN